MTTALRAPFVASALLVALAVIPASAQTRDAPGRYTMQPVEGGFLRLDTQTGAVSMCRPGEKNLVICQSAQDEQGLSKEIARLRVENIELKAEIKRLEDIVASGALAPPGDKKDEKLKLPTEQEVDQALDYVEKMFKKFRDRLRNLDSEAQKPGTPL
jgi:hypothetical protein